MARYTGMMLYVVCCRGKISCREQLRHTNGLYGAQQRHGSVCRYVALPPMLRSYALFDAAMMLRAALRCA